MEALPDEQKLKKALGVLYPAYREILDLAKDFDHEWKYYGRKIGWQLKTSRKGKSLFWLTPLEQSFMISFAVRESEKEALLHSTLPDTVKAELKAAKKYPEGYPLRLTIAKGSETKTARTAIDILIELRS